MKQVKLYQINWIYSFVDKSLEKNHYIISEKLINDNFISCT